MAQSRPNGLSSPAVVDLNGDSIADYVYAGDLFGNLWKFDLTSTNPANWRLMYSQPIFKAVNASGRAQPITERPQVDQGPNGQGMVVLFGTGKFLETSDRNRGSAIVQSFYGIYDANTGLSTDVVSGRNNLVQQSILGEGTTTLAGSTVGVRVTSNNTVDPLAKDGWFMDLVSPSGFQGEMQITDPVLRNGRVLFTTLIPDSDICAYGGRSWLMEVDAISGMRLDYSPFDFNADKTFNQSDYVTVSVGGSNVTVPASGFSRDAIMSRPAVISGEGIEYAINTDTSGGGLGLGAGDPPPVGLNPGPGAFGRQSWRQVR
jgi:type IV pilus assembly protein PilY1